VIVSTGVSLARSNSVHLTRDSSRRPWPVPSGALGAGFARCASAEGADCDAGASAMDFSRRDSRLRSAWFSSAGVVPYATGAGFLRKSATPINDRPNPYRRDANWAQLPAGLKWGAVIGAEPGPDGAFAPVEQCWHLADLEREGYGLRIARLLSEEAPALPDFDGARMAEERRYRTLSLAEGLLAFAAARRANLAALDALTEPQWSRAGTQEGVGPLMLCDVPAMMAEHDASHRAEIEAWSRARSGRE